MGLQAWIVCKMLFSIALREEKSACQAVERSAANGLPHAQSCPGEPVVQTRPAALLCVNPALHSGLKIVNICVHLFH